MESNLCIECGLFCGSKDTENKCSGCYGGPLLTETYTLNLFEEFNRTGVLSISRCTKECVICYENKFLISKFSCKCEYSCCETCSQNIKKCPTCRACKYTKIDSNDLYKFNLLLRGGITVFTVKSLVRWFHETIIKYRGSMDGVITLRTFYAEMKDIKEAMRLFKENGFYYGYTDKRSLHGFIMMHEKNNSTSKIYNEIGMGDSTDGCADFGIEERSNGRYMKNYDGRFNETHSGVDERILSMSLEL